jgi:hypothetical protein
MGIKRPSLFITILDFIVFLVLIIGLLQIHYDQDSFEIERYGRIAVSIMLFFRFFCSGVSEYCRQKRLKKLFIDGRDTFKLFAITRYIYLFIVMFPILVAAHDRLSLSNTLISIVSAILIFQEIVVLIMIAFKIQQAEASPKLKFIDKCYGSSLDS